MQTVSSSSEHVTLFMEFTPWNFVQFRTAVGYVLLQIFTKVFFLNRSETLIMVVQIIHKRNNHLFSIFFKNYFLFFLIFLPRVPHMIHWELEGKFRKSLDFLNGRTA